jgi:phosphoribosylpyrophosphate synthetase
VRASLPPASVVVSPDLGGAKRAERVARLLERPLAIVHKTRGERGVVVHQVLGDVIVASAIRHDTF